LSSPISFRRFVPIIWLLFAVFLAACQPRLPSPQPTLISEDLNREATAIVLTQNAPPTPFHEQVSLRQLSQGTDSLPSWNALVTLRFNGVFAGTSRTVTGSSEAAIQFNLLGTERRVVLTVDGALLDQETPLTTEGVRLGPDTFLVQDNTCAVTTNQSASAIADLGVDELIGGVTRAVPDATKAVINGEEVWRYSFNRDDLRLTNIEIAQDGRILDAQGELWFSPAREAAIRFYLSMDVENAYVFGSQLAVTGQAIMQYDLSGIGSEQNISVPFGC
jgi:hypothetical protein